ncbi:AAA family ATPase [Chromobacterium haemolyticum]|uniref:AAA family ATPase n=1 Tax=Chromobacterium haemolyticum TaxID=394935 RepID=UPI0013197EF8|nr:AAA family ATPase [Chromobacterium haemolyticum]BBH15055.1 hypothetical protein CH06BL_43030 [Chromobacterium haemolyticum]
MINYPYFHSVYVDDYKLYVGTEESPGLGHIFEPGVNVIVGINGLGKTTLLNILLRVLTGPVDYPSGEQLGSTKRSVVPVNRSWFRVRVPDNAVNATVTSEFWLGNSFFNVKRSLANLDLLELYIDQQEVVSRDAASREDQYRARIIEAANLSRFDDFIFLLRYIVFFLEDRRSLVWDPSAQGEALGILFGDGENRERFVTLFNELASKDSEYRNAISVVNRYEKNKKQKAATLAGGQLEMLLKQLEEQKNSLRDLAEQYDSLNKERGELRQAIENAQRSVFDRRSVLAQKLDSFYESFFPSLHDSARYLLSHFDSGAGCLVCGADGEAAISKVRGKLEVNVCPVCTSPLEHGDEEHTHDPYASEDIEHERNEIAVAENDIRSMRQELQKSEKEFSKVSAQRVALAESIADKENQIKDLGESVPEVRDALQNTTDEIAALKRVIRNIEIDRDKLSIEFRALAESIDGEVKSVSKLIEDAFSKYISGFLAEDCKVIYTTTDRSIGQLKSDKFPFPHFTPALTSGVFREGEMARLEAQSVSESQREFIDLAFRMALLEVAAPSQPSMIVLETPEASLDSVFVPRAADLLRRFATRLGERKNTRLIASSNVNRELMIPALFGVYPDQKFKALVTDLESHDDPAPIPEGVRYKHVLDLIKIAAPTRALEEFRTPYEAERDRAIYPERFQGSFS